MHFLSDLCVEAARTQGTKSVIEFKVFTHPTHWLEPHKVRQKVEKNQPCRLFYVKSVCIRFALRCL